MQSSSTLLRAQLKAATAAAHSSLEARIGPLSTRDAYSRYVRGLHAFRDAAENWLERSPADGAPWRAQRLADVLRQDLSDIAVSPIATESMTWRSDASFATGVQYVLEGSALGARVLCKQVAGLGFHRAHGARHLWAQLDAPGGWRAFLDTLGAHDSKIDAQRATAGANAAFHAAATAMERAAHG